VAARVGRVFYLLVQHTHQRRFQQHDDELLRRLVPGHHAVGALVARFLDLILEKVSEGVAHAGHRLARGVDRFGQP